MENTVGTKVILWGTIGAELLEVVFDLRYMILCAVVLILADMWWGRSESMKRLAEAKEKGSATLQDKYRWHKSRAVRRTMNKLADYITFLVLGALLGLAITEPLGICGHTEAAAIGMGIGGGCEVASIIGHVAYVKMGVEVSIADGWRIFMRFLGKLIKSKSEYVGEAVEDLGRERHRHHRHEAEIDVYDEESNMED